MKNPKKGKQTQCSSENIYWQLSIGTTLHVVYIAGYHVGGSPAPVGWIILSRVCHRYSKFPEIQSFQSFKVSRVSKFPEIQSFQSFKVSRVSKFPEFHSFHSFQSFKASRNLKYPEFQSLQGLKVSRVSKFPEF